MTAPSATAAPSPVLPASPLFMLFVASMTCIEFLQNTMVNFASSYIVGGIGAAPEEFSFAASAYAAAAILALFKHRWLVERIGYRDFALLSLLVYVAGTLLCATSGNVTEFVLGRMLQGGGGAAFFCAGRIILNWVPAPQRLRPTLAFILSLQISPVLAPPLAAWLIDRGEWRTLFWLMLPILLLVGVLIVRFMPTAITPPAERSQSHWGGLVWLVAGVLGLQYTMQRAQYDFFSIPLHWLGLAAVAGFALLWFCWRLTRLDRPTIDYKALFRARFVVGMMLYFFGYCVTYANFFVMPKLALQGLEMPVLSTGWLSSLSALGSVLAFGVFFQLTVRFKLKPKSQMLTGLAVLALYAQLMASLAPNVTWGHFALVMVVGGTFMSIFVDPVARNSFLDMTDEKSFSHAYQSKNILRELANSSAIALATLFLQSRNAVHTTRLSEQVSSYNPVYQQQFDQLNQWFQSQGAAAGQAGAMALSEISHQLGRQSMLLSCLDYYQALMAVTVLVAVVIYRQKVFL